MLFKIFLLMKWSAIFLFVLLLHARAETLGQPAITLTEKNAPLEKAFADIQKISGYSIWYDKNILAGANPVDFHVVEATLEQVMDACCHDQPITYTIVGKMIAVKAKEKGIAVSSTTRDVRGKVIDEKDNPLPGATITVRDRNRSAVSGDDGGFEIKDVGDNAVLMVSHIGYETLEMPVAKQAVVVIRLHLSVSKLDEVQVIGYGTTTQRLSTGSISKLSADDISGQPVANPIDAMEGRIPGLYIQSNGGNPGANYTIQLRGLNSITAGNNPLYIIDGVPFSPNTLDIIASYSSTPIAGGISPFDVLNPADIESIEVLKDADATAIYGSRGGNGVILITTKKGKPGKTKYSIQVFDGIGEVAHYVDMLNVHQYLALRRMAFADDGVTATLANAPDLLQWDTTKNTNWEKQLIGHQAAMSNAQISVSGGDTKTQFIVGLTANHQGTVLPLDNHDNRQSGYLNLQHNAASNKFGLGLAINYSGEQNNLSGDPTPFINLPPDYPVHDSSGRIIWRPGVYSEPFATMNIGFNNTSNYFLTNANIRYTLLDGLNIKANVGYSKTDLIQTQMFPTTAQNPIFSPLGFTYFGDNHRNTWIVEPQISYNKKIGIGLAEILIGSTFQQDISQGKLISASNYTSDAYISNIALAGKLRILNNNYTAYNYNSLFGRINYNIKNKYLVNASIRRDGSSRFGPDKEFGNFWSIGSGWIFSQEKFFQNWLPFLSFGKLRASYGITGSDQITDYQYLSTYTPTTYTYQIPGIIPSRIANPNYSWETTKKLEAAVDIGIIKDRIIISADHYVNTSGNELVNYPLPSQSGFTSYQGNLPATVRNSGWELVLSTINMKKNKFSWTSNFNISFQKNKLLSFPNIQNTPYGTVDLIIGQPLNLQWGYHYLGVDSKTGVAKTQDLNNNGVQGDYPDDYIPIGSILPVFYGGLSNNITYGNFRISFLIQFTKKIGPTLLSAWYSGIPGTIYNQDASVWNEIWMHPGDNKILPKPTMQFPYYYSLSDAGSFQDASYAKLKNLNISYRVNNKWLRKENIEVFNLFIQGQNLITFTKYPGFDPETSSPVVLPNLRILVAGIHCEF